MSNQYAIVYMNLGPYHMARLRALAQVLPEIHAIEVAAEQKLYPWMPGRDQIGFALTTFFADRPCEAVPARTQCEAVEAALSKIDPAVVIVAGYTEPVMRAATTWAWKRGIPTVLQFVSTYNDRPRKWWKEILKRRLITRYAAVAVMGQRAQEYALRLGAPRSRIRRTGNVVDNEYYRTRAVAAHQNEREQRKQLGLPDRYFLTVTRFSPEKNLFGLLRAFCEYRRNGGVWDLVLVGSGPEEQELRSEAQKLSVRGLHFVSWKSYEELPHYYALAACFILPSISEPWGLVVNEAMACGLPVLVSDRCGCAPELCKSGENGFAFDPYSSEDLARLMLDMSSRNDRLAAFGQAGRRIIASFTPQTWAQALRECIVAADGQRR